MERILAEVENSEPKRLVYVKATPDGRLLVSPDVGSGSGGGNSTESTQLLVKSAVEAINAKTPALENGFTPVAAQNFTAKFREAFETFPNTNWSVTADSSDIVTLDGNAAGASYLVISKSPFATGTSTQIETASSFSMPVEVAVGLHLSQRTLGQQFAVDLVSTEIPLAAPADVAISSIQQTTTTLSVTTATAHGLRPGMRIGIYGVAGDGRLNYPAVTVATAPTPTTFTVTAGPAGNIPSVTTGPFTTGYVFVRSATGFAKNGSSMVFENATATNACFYAKSEGGDATPIGGAVAGNHAVTIATTASSQAVNATRTYAFRPSAEFRVALMADRLQWQDAPVDAVTQATARATITQVVPNPDKSYKLRFRAENNKSMAIPVAEIVSATKTGTTTATVVTATAHGLIGGDYINAFGALDQTNFANLTAATVVASVIDATTFTVVWGAAVTATSYGGYVARTAGGQVMQGAVTQSVQSAAVTGGLLTLTGSAAWSGLLIGDLVDLYGCRAAGTGTALGLNGAYRVYDLSGTSLVLEPVGTTPTPADLVSTPCGGGVIKRTDLRISFARIFDFDRLRVESLSRPSGDVAGSAPVAVQNTPSVAQSGTWTVGLSASQTLGTVSVLTGGGAAEDALAGTNPVIVGGVVRTATSPTTLAAGDAVRATMTTSGAQVVKMFSVPETDWQYTGTLTTTTAAAAKTAGAAGIRNYVAAIQYQNTGATATTVIVLDGATAIATLHAPANMSLPAAVTFPVPLKGTAATALNVNCGTAGASVLMNVQGFQAA